MRFIEEPCAGNKRSDADGGPALRQRRSDNGVAVASSDAWPRRR
jgi:hypothetical protein